MAASNSFLAFASNGVTSKLFQAHKTLALRVELTTKPDLALRLLVFTLACDAIEPPWRKSSCLNVRVEDIDVSRSIVRCESRAADAYNAELESWKSILPGDPEALWAFMRGDQETLLKLLAVLIAPVSIFGRRQTAINLPSALATLWLRPSGST